MIRLSALFVAICMLVIAASLGALLFLAFGLTLAEAAMVALTALMGLALYNAIAGRRRDYRDLVAQITDLARGTADLAHQVAEQGRRLEALERKDDVVAATVAAATGPIQAEIRELGTLLQQLAEASAAHDAALRQINVELRAPPAAPIGKASATDEPPAAPEAAQPVEAAADQAEGVELELATGKVAEAEADVASRGPFQGMRQEAIAALIREAVDDNRIDLYLQPIVTLPQRKVRYYEAVMRLRRIDGSVLAGADFLDFAERDGLMPAIDLSSVYRCVRVLRRLMAKNRDVGLFCNLSAATLGDPVIFPQIVEYLEANRALANALVFEVRLDALRSLGQWENDNLGTLAAAGFHFSVDHVADLRFDMHDLSSRGCRFVKIPAALLLGPGRAAGDIDPTDLAGLLDRLGIELIAERIEQEATVVDLLDFDVKLAQGNLFSPPRPVRPDVMQPEGVAPPPRLAATKEEPATPPLAADVSPAAAERISALAAMARRVARRA